MPKLKSGSKTRRRAQRKPGADASGEQVSADADEFSVDDVVTSTPVASRLTMTALTTTPNQAFALALNATLPPSLDGSCGDNRGVGRQQIGANTDWEEAIRLWLSQYVEQAKTYSAYEKEVVRFYIWVLASQGKPLSSVVYEDWEAYVAFLADPQPQSVWIGTKTRTTCQGRHCRQRLSSFRWTARAHEHSVRARRDLVNVRVAAQCPVTSPATRSS